MKVWVRGASGADGKANGTGVRRRLGVWREGALVQLTPRCSSGTIGQQALVPADAFLEAVTGRVVTRLDGRTPTGLPVVVQVHREARHGPLDIGRSYVWIATEGEPEGWDFLGRPADLEDAARRAMRDPE